MQEYINEIIMSISDAQEALEEDSLVYNLDDDFRTSRFNPKMNKICTPIFTIP